MTQIISWLLMYSPVLQLGATLILSGALFYMAWQQKKLNEKAIEKPEWELTKISVGGSMDSCSARIRVRNIGGIARDVSVVWATERPIRDADYGDDERPRSRHLEDSDVTLRKRVDPGEEMRIQVDIENLEYIDHILLGISSKEKTGYVEVEGDNLRKSLEDSKDV